MSYYPIKIQKLDPTTEEWGDYVSLHALQVNKTGGGETYGAGAEQFHVRLTFVLRYCKKLEAAIYSPQTHRVVYQGRPYNIVDYDDYMEQHRTVTLVGEAYV